MSSSDSQSMEEPPAEEKHARMADETTEDDALPLDWTRVDRQDAAAAADDKKRHEIPIRYPWDVADINKQDTELVIVGTAGQKVTLMGTNLGDYCNPNLVQLILRSNLIRKMEGLSTFSQLQLLELYDNMIDELQCLNEGKGGAPGMSLQVLDMSYNAIRTMEPVQYCPNLIELCAYLCNAYGRCA